MTGDLEHDRHGRNEGRGRDDSGGSKDDCDRHRDEARGGGRAITIIVNGRERTLVERELSVDDLVKLAFEDPPTGEFICFTITYRRGRGGKREGALKEGETVKATKGMIFNVTATDKS